MNDEKKATIRECAEKAAILFERFDWGWIDGTGPGGVPTADDIYIKYRKGARDTRRDIRAGGNKSTYTLGRLIVRSYRTGVNVETGKPYMITEFGVETGYVL